jgi:hypothetical protein
MYTSSQTTTLVNKILNSWRWIVFLAVTFIVIKAEEFYESIQLKK